MVGKMRSQDGSITTALQTMQEAAANVVEANMTTRAFLLISSFWFAPP
jgi:hypothetical protein